MSGSELGFAWFGLRGVRALGFKPVETGCEPGSEADSVILARASGEAHELARPLLQLSVPLAPGSDAPAVIRFHGGGSAANTAAWLARAGMEPVLVGRVGDDERGRGASEELRAAGVDAQLAVDPELPTGTCVVLVGPEGERTMAPDAGANDALTDIDLADELLAGCRAVAEAGETAA